MDKFTIHITGTMDNDDGTVDVIDETMEGAYIYAIAGTATPEEKGEKHDNGVTMYGEWGKGELAMAFLYIMRAFGDPVPITKAMMHAFIEWQHERGIKIPMPGETP